jgi:hypothetical protein
MPEIGTSGSMSGDGKRSVGHRPQATAPILDSTDSAVSSIRRERQLLWDELPPPSRRVADCRPGSRIKAAHKRQADLRCTINA